MHYWFVERKGDKVFDHASLVLFIAVLVAVLTWLFPQQTIFYKEQSSNNIDSVSIAYLELLLQSAPHDAPLRLNLVDQLIHTGQFGKAISALSVLIQEDKTSEHSATINIMRLRIMTQLIFADNNTKTANIYRDNVNKLLDQMLASRQRKKDRLKMAELALAIGEPGKAAAQYEQLGIEDKARYKHWVEKSIRWYLAAGQHRKVSQLNLQLSHRSQNREQRAAYLKKAVDTLLILNDTETALSLYSAELEDSNSSLQTVLDAADLALALGNKNDVEIYLARVLKRQELTVVQLKRIKNTAIASANVDLAFSAVTRYLTIMPDDVEQIKTLARLYEWNGNLEKALLHWKMAARIERRPNTENTYANHTIKAIEESTAKEIYRISQLVYDHLAIIDVLETLGRQRKLTSIELNRLVLAYEDIGRPKKAVQYMQAHIRNHPDDRQALQATIYLLERDERVKEAIYLWGIMDKRFGLNTEDSQHVANLMWSQNDSESAFLILQQKIDSAKLGNKRYWRLLAALAWQQGDEKLAYESLRKVADTKNLTESESQILLLVQEEKDQIQQLQIAQDSWDRFKKPHYLLTKMQFLLNLQRWTDLTESMIIADTHLGLFSNNAQYWMIKAELQKQENNIKAAKHSYINVLSITGGDVQSVQNYLWFLVNTDSVKDLNRNLPKWQNMAAENKQLWPVYAVANTVLADYASALTWYKKILEKKPNDMPTLLAYADTLQLSGRTTAAWRLRRFLLQILRSERYSAAQSPYQYTETGDNSKNKLRLINAVYSYKDRRQAINNAHSSMETTDWLPIFTDQLIAHGQVDTAHYWQKRLNRSNGGAASEAQAASYAINNNDKQAMGHLLERGRKIGPAMEAYLLEKIGYSNQSMAVAVAALGSTSSALNDHQQSSLRVLLANQTEKAPSGLKLQITHSEFSDRRVNKQTITTASHWNEWRWQVELGHATMTDDRLIDVNYWSDENTLDLDISRRTRHGYWGIGTTLYEQNGKLDIGLDWSLQRQWSENLDTTLAVSRNDEANFSPVLDSLAYFHHVDFSLGQLISARDSINIFIQNNQFTSKYHGQTLSQGYRASINYVHKLNFANPLWALNLGVDWMRNKYSEVSGEVLLPYEGLGLSISAIDSKVLYSVDNVLSERFGQIALGTSISNGRLHAISKSGPSPRYLANAALTYQWDKSLLGVSVQAGIAWRILGNDELALSYQLNSSPWGVNNETQQDIKLSYNYRFGR